MSATHHGLLFVLRFLATDARNTCHVLRLLCTRVRITYLTYPMLHYARLSVIARAAATLCCFVLSASSRDGSDLDFSNVPDKAAYHLKRHQIRELDLRYVLELRGGRPLGVRFQTRWFGSWNHMSLLSCRPGSWSPRHRPQPNVRLPGQTCIGAKPGHDQNRLQARTHAMFSEPSRWVSGTGADTRKPPTWGTHVFFPAVPHKSSCAMTGVSCPRTCCQYQWVGWLIVFSFATTCLRLTAP